MERKPAANNSAEGRGRKRRRKGEILEMLLGGVPYTDIRRKCAIEYGVSFRTVEKYIAEVRSELPDAYSLGERRLLLGEAIGKAEKLYARSIAQKNLQVALGVLRWIGELQGLSAPQQVARIRNEQRLHLLNQSTVEVTSKDADGNVRDSVSLKSFNAIQIMYGLPQVSQDEWDAYQAGTLDGPLDN
jgi:hypothetical protein